MLRYLYDSKFPGITDIQLIIMEWEFINYNINIIFKKKRIIVSCFYVDFLVVVGQNQIEIQ